MLDSFAWADGTSQLSMTILQPQMSCIEDPAVLSAATLSSATASSLCLPEGDLTRILPIAMAAPSSALSS